MNELDTEVAVDLPDVVAEVRAVFDRYERALVTGDLAVLEELIWDDARTIRYGVADRQRAGGQGIRPSRRGGGSTRPRC
jgi:hypothetical protein